MKPEDVGLSKDLHFFKPKSDVERPPRVTSATIYKCDKFEVIPSSFFSCTDHIVDELKATIPCRIFICYWIKDHFTSPRFNFTFICLKQTSQPKWRVYMQIELDC